MKSIPKDGRGRPAITDWSQIKVGKSVKAGGGSAAYWSKKLGRRFVVRGHRVWRAA